VHTLNVKREHLKDSLARALVRSLCYRLPNGKVVIVTQKPVVTLAAVRKQWLRTERRLLVEHARTRKSTRIMELVQHLTMMRHTSFSAKLPEDGLESDVTFATADELIIAAPECTTMYVTYEVSKEKLYLITSWMPKNAQVVLYEQD
jgi:hypothetical protein